MDNKVEENKVLFALSGFVWKSFYSPMKLTEGAGGLHSQTPPKNRKGQVKLWNS